MGNKITVNEMDIDEEMINQHSMPNDASQPASPGNEKKGVTLKVPSLPKPNFSALKQPKFIVAAALVVLAGSGGFLGYKEYTALKAENQRLSNPQIAAEDDANRIISEVSNLIELPAEQPTIATVTDVERLQDQAFFANAQNGDRVILYSQAKKAILYRPSTKKIVEVAPINLGDQAAQEEGTTAGASTEESN